MRRTTLPVAAALAALLGFVAAPTGAATTGTLCGQVTAFTAPTATTDGSITIDGTVEVIDQSAFGMIEADVITVLSAVAAVDATTCLEVTANTDGEIVDLSIAAEAEICGTVTLDTATGVFSIDGVAIPAGVVTADADLRAVLDAAAAAGASACLDVAVDSTTGLIASAAVTADFVLCGTVTLDAEGNATVDGVTIDADLLNAGATVLLELAATADGMACATVVAVSGDGETSVTVAVTVEVCAEVTAIGDGTITLDGVTLGFAGAADSTIEVGDTACVTAATGPTGEPIVTEIDPAGAAPAEESDRALLPDTATGTPVDPLGLGGVLLVVAAAFLSAARRLEGSPTR